jgi:hypothetical protein
MAVFYCASELTGAQSSVSLEEIVTPTRTHRLPSNDIQADRQALNGIQLLNDYAPMNRAYSTEHLEELGRAMEAAHQAEARAVQAQAIARELAIATEWALHDALLGAKTQVIAQYGPDDHAVQLLGLKRKSERRRPVRRATEAT